jgi:hypothetical protein
MISKQTFIVTKFCNKTFEKGLQINFIISVSNNFESTIGQKRHVKRAKMRKEHFLGFAN